MFMANLAAFYEESEQEEEYEYGDDDEDEDEYEYEYEDGDGDDDENETEALKQGRFHCDLPLGIEGKDEASEEDEEEAALIPLSVPFGDEYAEEDEENETFFIWSVPFGIKEGDAEDDGTSGPWFIPRVIEATGAGADEDENFERARFIFTPVFEIRQR